MPETYTRPYIDSSVWIGWIKGETVNGINRKEVFEHILLLAERGDYQVYTSTATLAEVHKRKSQLTSLTNQEDEQILQFFENEFIVLIDVDREIGEEANRICRNISLSSTGASVKPFDAIHLASALRANCDYLLCWDGVLLSCKHPKLIIAQPQKLGQQMFPTQP